MSVHEILHIWAPYLSSVVCLSHKQVFALNSLRTDTTSPLSQPWPILCLEEICTKFSKQQKLWWDCIRKELPILDRWCHLAGDPSPRGLVNPAWEDSEGPAALRRNAKQVELQSPRPQTAGAESSNICIRTHEEQQGAGHSGGGTVSHHPSIVMCGTYRWQGGVLKARASRIPAIAVGFKNQQQDHLVSMTASPEAEGTEREVSFLWFCDFWNHIN